MSSALTGDTIRERVVQWGDPMQSANAMRGMDGLAALHAIFAGELPRPPIMELLNIQGEHCEPGRVIFSVVPAEYHYNPIGTVHGGLAATICDSAMACAIQSMLPVGVGYTTLELKLNYIRPITVTTGRLECEGKIIHVGGRVATAEGRLSDASGKLYAHSTTTCIILRPEKP